MHNAVNTVLPDWDKVHRLVPSHFPPIDLFENVEDPDELEIVFALEAMTNDRLLQEAGDLFLVPKEDRVSGPGTTPLMAAFTHVGIATRFTNGDFGVYYGAKTLKTAIEETIYHRELFLAATDEDDTELTMRCYINQIALEMHDVRGDDFNHLYGEDYAVPQAFAKEMKESGSHGLLYDSVRDKGGECIAAFRPTALTPAIQGSHYRYLWSGKKQKIEHVLEVSLRSRRF